MDIQAQRRDLLKARLAKRNKKPAPEPMPIGRRRWDAGNTTRLNKTHWSGATDASINVDLWSYQDTLRARSSYEAANNPIVAGVIETHVNAVVGKDGPTLQVQSASKRYTRAAEAVWKDFWALPDLAGQLSGADILKLWQRCEWSSGEYLGQIALDESLSRREIRTRIRAIHPRRLATPMDRMGDPRIIMGIERDRVTGKPISYWVEEQPESETQDTSGIYRAVPALDVIHGFAALEPGQARGVPLLAPALDTIGELRDYDSQVLDAARAAADFSVVLSNPDGGAEYAEFDDCVDIERRMMITAPPGWTPHQMKPEQPTTNYKDYRHEMIRAVGRVVNMPLMMVLLDSSGHNYSSARFDGRNYDLGNSCRQAMFGNTLNRIAWRVFREAELLGILPPRPPDVRLSWLWPRPPHVDPTKEASAQTELLANGTLTFADACAESGTGSGGDWEANIEQRAREQGALLEAGLPVPWGSPPAEPDPEDSADEKAAGANRTLEDMLWKTESTAMGITVNRTGITVPDLS